MRYAPAILVGRSVRVLARLRKPGGGSAVPGLVVNRLAPGYLAQALNSFPQGLVIVSGSSGKSTTTKMLVAVLRAHGRSVFTNPSTANIAQGLTSALLEQASLTGRIPGDIGVLEMDEGHGARIAPALRPRVVAITNVMVDQIDRFHDSEMVAGMLGRIAARASETVVVNGDDAYALRAVEEAGASAHVRLFGVSEAVLESAPHGLGNAALTPSRIEEGVIVVGVHGRRAELSIDGTAHVLGLPARGVHYATDAAAALATASAVLGTAFDIDKACEAIGALPPVFGRGEVVEVRGQSVEFVLVQNPASFQLNVDTIDPDGGAIMVAVGSDVRDPSYLWPVDTSRLRRVAMVSGSKAYAIALQLAYDGVQVERIEPNLARAIDDFLALPTDGAKTIVFSADSMRRTRTHLGLDAEGDEA
ncbi:MurT ligase domain-containing protein [Rathayibacter sp. YIM 133350]|uniref:MurT ligase domain-containing protein n=1 Tax=Rathayibacter sp. YIM 133350 TaxID=3131992 RepID=UPI00307EE793